MDVIRAILVSAEAVAKLDWGEDLVERGEKGEFIWSQKEMFGESGNWVKEKERPIQSDNDIKRAAKEWCNNRSATEAKYGHIKDWDTSAVTDMKEEFDKDRAGQGALQFNDDISRWNVGNCVDMGFMFRGAKKFNQDISGWNVGNCMNMHKMFSQAKSFSKSTINNWNLSGKSIGSMFANT
ncbi:hypothetical protein TrLO_g6157 [Triparma laevis f. longispina]|uniref:BspA family leucine-rich repeat surface protein n=1 Tax=Triparma laevis f. longispina TaxID=1714387 RepID=A0A9W7DMJ9_9STRA|nr:hypothetical protein TrLO_g6157 [Triparma laevis f. longispina]